MAGGLAQLGASLPAQETATATPTVMDPRQATGTPGQIPIGNPPEPVNLYPNTGNLTQPEPKPYTPAGGLNTNSTPPVYQAMSDFDWQSINLALNQEWIELDLFYAGLERFSVEEFEAYGLTSDDRDLIAFMGSQEIGHATLLSNILGPNAAKRCRYQYPFKNVAEFIDFSQKLTRWGESGVYGFIEHLDSRAAAQLLLQSITTEARQQMIFRQFEGLFPMPVWFEAGVSQSMAWTLLAPYIKSCPPENPKLAWQNFPALYVTNNPNGTDPRYGPAITHNRTQLTYPGREVTFRYEEPGQTVGPDDLYVTNTTAQGPAKFAAWISQLNITYTPLYGMGYSGKGTVKATQPKQYLFSELNPALNGTVFVALVDEDIYLTPHNVSIINDHIVAGPALYQAG
ncbi:stress response protein Rds1 [Choiromyces venosus 120613-1]|uniref:Stress response protein Rds1 n=1 Tax=Choiromyces venosus 120613-1 TaxID=1336337 RepID=A0A3N4IYB4_9PEZI|nr:stress response protein Rds1 [Choiromyces venosus 120613-1]